MRGQSDADLDTVHNQLTANKIITVIYRTNTGWASALTKNRKSTFAKQRLYEQSRIIIRGSYQCKNDCRSLCRQSVSEKYFQTRSILRVPYLLEIAVKDNTFSHTFWHPVM